MPAPSLISDPEQVTSTWLTEVMQQAGIDGEVSGFRASSIGTGQVGENVRFELEGNGDLPATVVGKFPSVDPISRQTGIAQGNYIREVHFYQHLQDSLDIQTPHDFYTAIDPESHEFVIVMEDLAPGVQGDQIVGCGKDEAELALTQLARLHGPRWGDDSLIIENLIGANDEERAANIKALYDMVSPGFLERYADRLSDDEQQMVNLVGENLMSYQLSYQGTMTLIHIDYRLDNMMFGGPYPLAVVDWQSIAFGSALNDVSYFTGTSVHEELRRDLDESLLRSYFDELSRYDVDLSWDDCWHSYRQFAPAGLIMAVIASMIVGETERGNDMFMAMAKRSARMSAELGTIDLL